MSTLTLIDYDAGNLASLEGALERLGVPFIRAASPDQIAPEGPIILPGVGHFEAAQRSLRQRGWWSLLPALVAEGRPLLGICLGLQLLAEESEEAPGVPGLGLLPGRVRRLGPGVKVPHMGWSRVRLQGHPALNINEGGSPARAARSASPLVHPHVVAEQSPATTSALPSQPDPWLYFVHSFALEPSQDTLGTAEHGRPFAAIQGRGRVLGFQPHPEKSGAAGLALLQSTLAWMGATSKEAPCN